MKKISVAICVDDGFGISFASRRQSRDRVLIKDLVSLSRGKIYMKKYSSPLFSEYEDVYVVSESPIDDCPDGGLCFIECEDIAQREELIGRLILYKWNRAYPSDVKLGLRERLEKSAPTEVHELVGHSHEKITREIYEF